MTAPTSVTVDGRTVLAFDAGPAGAEHTVMWHHGTPQTGRPLPPVVEAAAARGVRVVAYARPGYGSTPLPGRDVAAAAVDTAAVADLFGVQRFWTMGASGGGPHALAGAALLPDRIAGVVTLAGIAPRVEGSEWFDGMADPSGLQAAAEGREARERWEETAEFDPASFTDRDWEALRTRWAALGRDAMRGGEIGTDGAIDDDVAFASPWGFPLSDVGCPALFVQGGADRVVPPAHARRLVAGCPDGELWERPRDGHVSVLDATAVALDWLLDLSR